MISRYSPGEWFVLVSGTDVVLLPAEVGATTAEKVWVGASGGGTLARVLDALTGAFGSSLTAIPPFVVMLADRGSVRVIVRGPQRVRVRTAAGVEEISGESVTTWTERYLVDATDVEIGEGADAGSLPLRDGIVRGSAVRLTLDVPVASDVADVAEIVVESAPGAEVPPEPEPEPESDAEPEPGAEVPPAPEPEPESEPAAGAPPEPDAEVPPEPEAEPTGEIGDAGVTLEEIWAAESLPADDAESGLPSPEGGDPAELAPATDPVAEPGSGSHEASIPVEAVDHDDTFDGLWGPTVAKAVADAAVRPVAEEEPADAPDGPGDHDGETISWAQMQAMRAGGGEPPPQQPPSLPSVRIEVSTGESVLLDRPVVVGRRPRAVRVTPGAVPHLIAVESPQQDISRSHVEIRREGEATLAEDLDTTNGTILLRGGSAPLRLEPNRAHVVIDGDVLDLGDGVTIKIRELA